MSDEKEVEFDPRSLRNTIRIALGDQWTHEIEEKLFWPLAAFNSNGCDKTRKETLAKIHDALGITDKLHLAAMGFPPVT